MTKIHIISDLHLEYNPYIPLESVRNVDIVILAGDIHSGTKGLEWARSHFPNSELVYISGNHEFYKYDYHELLEQFRIEAKKLDIHFLENDEVVINSIRILGCTLWSDYTCSAGYSQDESMKQMNMRIADHQLIRVKHSKEFPTNFLEKSFSTKDAWRTHTDSVVWLTKKLFDEKFSGNKTIVATHHGPSLLCKHKVYGHSGLSGAFYSSLDNLLKQTDLWIYGHTHSNLDIQINSKTRLISNQRGYQNENIDGFDENLIIEL